VMWLEFSKPYLPVILLSLSCCGKELDLISFRQPGPGGRSDLLRGVGVPPTLHLLSKCSGAGRERKVALCLGSGGDTGSGGQRGEGHPGHSLSSLLLVHMDIADR
jgi:hypothetical protein